MLKISFRSNITNCNQEVYCDSIVITKDHYICHSKRYNISIKYEDLEHLVKRHTQNYYIFRSVIEDTNVVITNK